MSYKSHTKTDKSVRLERKFEKRAKMFARKQADKRDRRTERSLDGGSYK
jgi:hypothetical protein